MGKIVYIIITGTKLYGDQESITGYYLCIGVNHYIIPETFEIDGNKSILELAHEVDFESIRISNILIKGKEYDMETVEKLPELIELLKVSKCPNQNCIDGDLDCGDHQIPCRWCDEKKELLNQLQ